MTIHYESYDVAFKINCVEEYLQLKKDNPDSIGYGSYASSKGIGRTTFISWVKKYETNKEKYFSAYYNKEADTNSDVIIENNIINAKPQFIRLSKPLIKEDPSGSIDNKISITSDNLSLSFDIAHLEKVLEVLRK